MPTLRKVGDTVTLTAASFQNVWIGNRSIHAYPSDEFVTKLRPYIGQRATVTHVFPPGYEVTIEFSDGQAFHSKDHWVE